MGTGTIPSLARALCTVKCNPSERFFSQPDLQEFPYMHVLITSQLKTWVTLCWCSASLSVELSPFSYSVLQILVALVSMDLQICLNSGSPLGPHWFLLPSAVAWNSIKAIGQGNWRIHLAWFSSLRYHSPSLPDKQCLKNCHFIYFATFWLFQAGK